MEEVNIGLHLVERVPWRSVANALQALHAFHAFWSNELICSSVSFGQPSKITPPIKSSYELINLLSLFSISVVFH